MLQFHAHAHAGQPTDMALVGFPAAAGMRGVGIDQVTHSVPFQKNGSEKYLVLHTPSSALS
jgi:hypothetical protein